MKYQVGDRVKVRDDLEAYEMYGVDSVVPQMLPFRGETVTLTAVRDGEQFFVADDCGEWSWTPEMFEGLAE